MDSIYGLCIYGLYIWAPIHGLSICFCLYGPYICAVYMGCVCGLYIWALYMGCLYGLYVWARDMGSMYGPCISSRYMGCMYGLYVYIIAFSHLIYSRNVLRAHRHCMYSLCACLVAMSCTGSCSCQAMPRHGVAAAVAALCLVGGTLLGRTQDGCLTRWHARCHRGSSNTTRRKSGTRLARARSWSLVAAVRRRLRCRGPELGVLGPGLLVLAGHPHSSSQRLHKGSIDSRT